MTRLQVRQKRQIRVLCVERERTGIQESDNCKQEKGIVKVAWKRAEWQHVYFSRIEMVAGSTNPVVQRRRGFEGGEKQKRGEGGGQGLQRTTGIQ